MFWIFMLLTLSFDLVGVIAGRYSAERKDPWLFLVCVVSFLFVGLWVAFMMQYRGVAIATMVWSGLTSVLALLAGYYLFQERFSTQQMIGTALIFAGVSLVEWPQNATRAEPGDSPSMIADAPVEQTTACHEANRPIFRR